jgi:quinol monooxygenase YgiN
MTSFGMIGTFTARPGRRDELLAILREGSTTMDGCELYVVGAASEDPDTVCVAELWRDEASHAASLQLPQVRATIERAMPHIASIGGTQFAPLFGVGPGFDAS